ncbi:MAG: M14 family metallopeptidase [Longimicrobiales bacterium]
MNRFLVWAAVVASFLAAPAAAQVPTPESVLGHVAGADFELADWDETLGYFQALDAASDWIQLVQVGHSSFGRPWYIAVISAPANLAQLDRYREISLRLAHPAGLTDEEARELAQEGRAMVHIDGGMHSTEVANTQHTIQFAYELLSTVDEARTQEVLNEAILFLWPTLNPDGLQLVADWYASNVGTPYEVSPMPWLYQKYIGHDNNRDAYMLNAVETRTIVRTWREWEPQIIHTHHQSSPFPTRIWLPPFAEPVSPRAPGLIARTINTLGMTMAQALEEKGQVGATHMDTFDAWYPGYTDYLPVFQNIAAYWTETSLYRYATPRFYRVSDFPDSRAGLRAEALYSSPWQGGWWRIGDAVSYMVTASHAVLGYAADHREQLLYNRYQSGRDQIRYFQENPPYAYLIRPDQPDPVAVVELLRRFAFLGVPVQRLGAAVRVGDTEYPTGTWVVRTDHEYGELVRVLMEVQEYPDLREFPDGPPSQPYDVAGWTLPHLMGVRAVEVGEPLTDDLKSVMVAVSGEVRSWSAPEGAAASAGFPVADIADFGAAGARQDATAFDTPRDVGFDSHPTAAGIAPPPGRVQGSGSRMAVSPAQNNAFRAINETWRQGGQVRFVADSTSPRGGRYLLEGVDDDRLATELALQATGSSEAGVEVPRPRVGLYRPWTASMDEGWTRWLLERFDFSFTSVRNADLHAGDLKDRYDVIVLPAERVGALMDGHRTGSVPSRYAGGMGEVGLRALDAFVRAGGRLVALNQSSDLLIEALALPVKNVVADEGRADFFSTGSLFEVEVNTGHPIMAGMPARASVFFDRGPVFETTEGFEGDILAEYAEHGSPLVSGYLLGEEKLQGKAAVLTVRHGAGRIVLFGVRPQWRGQTFGTFRMFFNSLLVSGF